MTQTRNHRDDYEVLLQLYDLTEELADTVESKFVNNPDDQLALVAPIIEEVGEAADILTEEFVTIAGAKTKRKKLASSHKIEAAMRKIYIAMDDYAIQVCNGVKESAKSLKNIADTVVEKIRTKLEEVIVIFLNLVELSLDRVMHKQELEELRRRDTQIAMHLHGLAQQAH